MFSLPTRSNPHRHASEDSSSWSQTQRNSSPGLSSPRTGKLKGGAEGSFDHPNLPPSPSNLPPICATPPFCIKLTSAKVKVPAEAKVIHPYVDFLSTLKSLDEFSDSERNSEVDKENLEKVTNDAELMQKQTGQNDSNGVKCKHKYSSTAEIHPVKDRAVKSEPDTPKLEKKGLVIRCPFSGVSIDLEETSRKLSQPLPEIKTVCAIEKKSLKPELDNGISSSWHVRRRKFGVTARPHVSESDEDYSLNFELKTKLDSLNRRTKSDDSSKKLGYQPIELPIQSELGSEGCLADAKIPLQQFQRHSASLASTKAHSLGSAVSLLDNNRISTASPSFIPDKVTERTRASDQTCAMYGMLLLSACQFGQVSHFHIF